MSVFIEVPANKASLARRKLIYGIGINDADYIVMPKVNGKSLFCPYYLTWKNMLKRCYCPKYQEKHPTYIGCSVVSEWITFSAFKNWMAGQDWKEKELDKDILILGNKEYSPNACIFISGAINKLLNDHAAARGDLPQGVNFDKNSGKYRAQCAASGKRRHLGLFTSIPKAEHVYLMFKSALVKKIAFEVEEGSNPKLQAALLIHADLFKQKAECVKL